jgi:Fe-S-cluster-containing dehydrogenase component/DMSO reductase anchor subunit
MIDLPVLNVPVRRDSAEQRQSTGVALIANLLVEQQSLSAVDAFSRWHTAEESEHLASCVALPRYRSLMPATTPAQGQQYAFEVDLDRCSGCKSCVAACHTLNGLDENESWRDVGLLIGGSRTAPMLQHVTAACHHCLEPACLSACPVNAYEKDPLTGIVKHLDDQCFGCQYCTMACPYDVPKYLPRKGIVRKCDMCQSRLAVGEPPACVQACPHEAIAIRVVNQQQIVEDAEAAVFLPAAPDPQVTLPTTSYVTRRPFPRNLLPADYFRTNPQHAHWPLVVMLVLTQLSVGAFMVGLLFEQLRGPNIDSSFYSQLRSLHGITSLAFGLLALAASLFHLGRPRYAYRAALGLRHSWLSREIVAFTVFAGLATTYAGVLAAQSFNGTPALISGAAAADWLGWAVAASGTTGLFCSAMVYAFTRRECWSFGRVVLRFSLTAALLGIATGWLSILLATVIRPSPQLIELIRQSGPRLGKALVTAAGVKLLWEAAIFQHLLSLRITPLRRSALLLTRDLAKVTLARFTLGLLGGLLIPVMQLRALPALSVEDIPPFLATTVLLFAACLAGELLERHLFFSACAAPRMPGAIR